MPVSIDLSPSSPLPNGLGREIMHRSPSTGELSVIQRCSTAVEVCDATYPSFLGTSEFFYDSRAGTVYENPLITATSRALISDLHALTRRCCAVDVPRPAATLCSLLRAHPPDKFDNGPWFKAIRSWAEIDDISEAESFDGHKKSFVEYTVNVLFFPDLHTTYRMPKTLVLRHPPPSPVESPVSLSVPAAPLLSIPGTLIAVPSPLHIQLPVMTRLCFNEQGQITYHRDIWDLRDVARLIPGVRVALWIMARAGAWGLSWISQVVCSDARHGDSMKRDNELLTSADKSGM